MTRMNAFRPTAVPQTFRISLANRAALETLARDGGREFSAIINDSMSRYFLAVFPTVARACGIEAPATEKRRP